MRGLETRKRSGSCPADAAIASALNAIVPVLEIECSQRQNAMTEAQRKSMLEEVDAADQLMQRVKPDTTAVNNGQAIAQCIALQQMSKSLNRLRIRLDQGQPSRARRNACTSPTFAWWNKKDGFK